MESSLISDLRKQRRRLLQSYVVHVIWLSAMVATAVIHASPRTIAIATMLALITVPPVIAYAAAVHPACRAIDPGARTIGLVPMIIMTVIFTPFESGLIVPAKNLFVSAKLLDQAWGLFYPRGGMAMHGVSLAIANSLIWAGAQPHRSLNMRFQLAAAGWLWLVVQGAGLTYLYSQTGTT